MSNIIKEIIIILLIILLSMLLFAVILYEYIPNRIQTAETATYSATDDVKNSLKDSVASDNSNIILTYEVTSTDLNNYQNKNEYVPGKQNPFSVYTNQTSTTTNSSSSVDNNTNSSTSDSTEKQNGGTKNETNTTSNEENNSYFKNTGTK